MSGSPELAKNRVDPSRIDAVLAGWARTLRKRDARRKMSLTGVAPFLRFRAIGHIFLPHSFSLVCRKGLDHIRAG
jgi:hypothetical protein